MQQGPDVIVVIWNFTYLFKILFCAKEVWPVNIVSWELEGCYQYSYMFHLEPERHYRCIKVYGDSALLVINRTSLNSDSALLNLNWWYAVSQGAVRKSTE